MEFIASGGNGRVYKAEDVLLNIMVALKVLLGDQSNTDDVMRFQSEAKAASRLKHPAIATIYDFGLVDDCPYLSMEFVEGETLEKLLEQRGTLPLPAFCSLFLQISKALSHAHQNGVIHRDLKPANVIVRYQENGELVGKILDFGVAKLIDKSDFNLTPTGNIVGSPLYMSPEQALGERVTSQADLYSLGVMMFRSLAGKVPLKSETAIETIMLVSKVSAPLLESSVIPGELPPELCDLVNKLLSKNPVERPGLNDVVIPTLDRLLAEISSQPQAHDDGDDSLRRNVVSVRRELPTKIILMSAVVVTAGSLFAVFSPDLTRQHSSKIVPEDKPILSEINEANEKQLLSAAENFDNKPIDKSQLNFTNRESFSDDELVKIPQPESITTIKANGTGLVTLASMPRFSNLAHLSVGKTKISDQSLKNLRGLKHLLSLDLRDNNITDAAMPMICSMKSLTYLDLSSTHVTPNGLNQLESLTNLKELKLLKLNLKPNDIGIFASSVAPECKVSLIGSGYITESELPALSAKFPDLKFEDLPSLTSKQSNISILSSRDELLTARHVHLDMKKRLEDAYGLQTLRTRHQIFLLGKIERLIGKPNNLKKAKEYLDLAHSMSVKANDRTLEMNVLDQVVSIGYLMDGYEKTKKLALHAIEVAHREKGNAEDTYNLMAYRYTQLGQSALASGKPTEAIQYFTKAIESGKFSQGALGCMLTYRGTAYVTAKKYNLGIADHKRALQLFKDSAPNDPSEAQKYYAELNATCLLAHSFEELKDYKQGLKYNSEFYRLAHQRGADPKHVSESVYQRILLMQKLKRPESELAPLRKEFDVSQRLLLTKNGEKKP